MTSVFGAMRERRILAGACWAATGCLALLAVGCGSVAVGELPLRQDFTECDDFSSNDDVATVDCPEGELRILVSQPERSPIHIVPFRFDQSEPRLAVAADVRLASGKGAYGIGCAVSAPGEPGRAYLFLTVRGDPEVEGAASIVRVDWTESEGQTLETLAHKRKAVLGEGPHRMRGECTSSADGSARLRMSVDGRVLLQVRDQKAMGPFTAAAPVLIATAPDSDVRFDNLHAVVAQP